MAPTHTRYYETDLFTRLFVCMCQCVHELCCRCIRLTHNCGLFHNPHSSMCRYVVVAIHTITFPKHWLCACMGAPCCPCVCALNTSFPLACSLAQTQCTVHMSTSLWYNVMLFSFSPFVSALSPSHFINEKLHSDSLHIHCTQLAHIYKMTAINNSRIREWTLWGWISESKCSSHIQTHTYNLPRCTFLSLSINVAFLSPLLSRSLCAFNPFQDGAFNAFYHIKVSTSFPCHEISNILHSNQYCLAFKAKFQEIPSNCIQNESFTFFPPMGPAK